MARRLHLTIHVPRRVPRAIRAGWVAGCLMAAAAGQSAGSSDLVDAGRRLYRAAEGSDGTSIEATTQHDVRLATASAACVGCHRRSGLGGSEGPVRSPPVTGAALFSSRETPPRRPAYDDTSLRRAVTQGIGADGRTLDALMPRYRLTDDDLAALAAYLRTLGAEPSPGVASTAIELATIVTDDAAESDVVVEVLRRFTEIKNAGTRNETRRAAAAQHPYGERRDRAFRRWHLSVWRLEGPASTWDSQLSALYDRHPPFAVVSGATGHDWLVVHRFCEQRELPCILPIADAPPGTGGDFYSLYFSEGVRLEARAAARHIAATADDPAARVLLVYGDDERGRAAGDAFVNAWRGRPLVQRRIAAGTRPTRRQWQEMVSREQPDILVAWLTPWQLQTLSSIVSGMPWLPRRIYTAEGFAPWLEAGSPAPFLDRVHHVYPYRLPAANRSRFPREQTWLRGQGLDDLNAVAAAKVLFACHVVGEALADIQGNFYRDYLLEELEHMLDGTSMTSLYPTTALGPGQRRLVTGSYVVRLGRSNQVATYNDPDWIAP